MSIYSKILGGVKKAVSNTSSLFGNAFSGATNALGITGPLNPSPYGQQTADTTGFQTMVGGKVNPAINLNPPTPTFSGFGGSGQTSGAGSTGSFATTPRTISGGSNSSLTSPIYGPSSISNYNPTATLSGGKTPLGAIGSTIGTNILSQASAPSVNLPPKPSYKNVGAIDNSGVANILAKGGFVQAENGQFVRADAEGDQATKERLSLQKDLMGLIQQKDNVQTSPEFQGAQDDLNKRKEELAGYTASLNAVVAKRDADLLRLREVGSKEGVTEAVYGGQESTINREAAIRALPIQAQVAAAQNNVQLAQDYLTQVTSFKQEQINNEFNYKNALVDSISGFLTGEQKIKADEIKQNNDRAWQIQTSNIEAQEKLALEFAKSGQASLIDTVYGLNTNSPDFGRQYARLASQLTTTGNNYGEITAADKTKGMNYLLTNGGTQDDIEKFKTDRAFQAWVLNQA